MDEYNKLFSFINTFGVRYIVYTTGDLPVEAIKSLKFLSCKGKEAKDLADALLSFAAKREESYISEKDFTQALREMYPLFKDCAIQKCPAGKEQRFWEELVDKACAISKRYGEDPLICRINIFWLERTQRIQTT